jgi:hypothetical protein
MIWIIASPCSGGLPRMGRAELTLRVVYGICASIYFSLPLVSLMVALAFGAAGLVLLLTLVARPTGR